MLLSAPIPSLNISRPFVINGAVVQVPFNNNSADTAGSVLCGRVIDNCILTGLIGPI